MRIGSGGIELPISGAPPEVMHIDLNSAFAMAEQQARPHLRGRAVGVTNRLHVAGSQRIAPWSICITSSYEAKRQGITIGTRHDEAKLIDPNFVMLESNPWRYITTHRRLLGIFQDYSPVAFMKSIDEGIIDFRGMRAVLKGRSLEDVAREIKQRVKEEVGDYMTVNVGIGQNRWLAKVAAGLNKPNGLDVIHKDNLRDVLGSQGLTDLPYVKRGVGTRLRLAGIYSPVEFLEAPYWQLFRQVFGSVMGHHWYLKLRGYETEVDFGTRTAGRSYVLENRTSVPEDLLGLIYLGAIKVSRKLWLKGLYARGLSLSLRYAIHTDRYTPGDNSNSRWRDKRMWQYPARRPDELFERAAWLFKQSPPGEVVTAYELTAYGLQHLPHRQLRLFEDADAKREWLYEAMDDVFDQYGELSLMPASVLRIKRFNPMKDKIPFYNTSYFNLVGDM